LADAAPLQVRSAYFSVTEALELSPDDRALEVGTGSGYAAAVLSRIAYEVYTVERHPRLARDAEAQFQRLGYDNICVRVGDGTLGWAEYAPYDAIVVTAGGPEIPAPLQEQLAVGGRLVIPVGASPDMQQLVRVRRTSREDCRQENLGGVRFVPLVGEAGWNT
jgi:protein-L-isoaspartate(D-aspartate) O-methyltransferase